MTQQEDKQIALTILEQINQYTIKLNNVRIPTTKIIGAHNHLFGENYLQFGVKGNRHFNKVVIKLNSMDYYDIELWNCKILTKDPYIINDKVKEFNDIDCSQLGKLIYNEVLYNHE